MPEPNVECPSCGKEPTEIYAVHNYSIKYDYEQGQWVKETGEVIYVCGLCLQEVDTHDIESILKQVDEL